ncbi:type VII secretion-associated serine protease mycosin [Gordonia amicalis]|uniref:Type VII secretion-associated serine protease mycosin n=1 Tax=Gordonia amicalis TaxID=89053 RepID=A0AAE4R0T4_9ACTN|nr:MULTISPECIES: type VII secretion-associated serine protease mycosin [Gordonia]ATD70223.1 type VII secretion-associated serine protease mycosin [Gordonia sp. 1D]MBA5849147.1 type VII secretion-associated serine protease mycosin [Gordonia amicalis]MCZ4578149.1 type VII secretion-associated serine protease mycosin [Gordonia amicalis]MDV6306752.1 type VII secretion-associated serine protease mycosin [Gordonia amicalis]MDV6310949.1 type VII secretion-associated serine protease mycosin [Gordonia 
MSRARTRIAAPLALALTATLLGLTSSPAAAVTPPRVDASALIRSAPVAPPEPTEQSHLCNTATLTRNTANPTAAQSMMNLEEAWRFSRGAGQRVAVIDTGVTPHPRLGRVTAGGDYVSNGTGLEDCDAHGTLVAGIIAARPSTSDAFAGVAPAASIIGIRQSSSAFKAKNDRRDDDPAPAIGSGYGSVRTLAHAIVRAVDLRATVINISEVACAPAADKVDDRALGAAIRYAYDRDVVVVAAAGNITRDGACQSQNPTPPAGDPDDWSAVTTIASPAWYSPYVLTVASIDAATGTPSDFSLHGPWVGVAAPGTDIVSLDSAKGSGRLVSAQRSENGPLPLIGTSFAAPYVAGTAALVRARFPDLSAREVMDRIVATAHAPGTGHDQRIGHGVVDPVSALTAELPADQRAGPQSAPIAAPAPPTPPDHTARNVAVAGAGVSAALIATVLAIALPHRRVRKLDPDEF